MCMYFCYSVNGNDSCTELLLDTLGDGIVNLQDSKGRYVQLDDPTQGASVLYRN